MSDPGREAKLLAGRDVGVFVAQQLHPFREGNGRISRLLATLMALQAGLPLLDFSVMNEQKAKYFAAVQVGLSRNYRLMEAMFAEIIENSISASGD